MGRFEGICKEGKVGAFTSICRQVGYIELSNEIWSNRRFIVCIWTSKNLTHSALIESESTYVQP